MVVKRSKDSKGAFYQTGSGNRHYYTIGDSTSRGKAKAKAQKGGSFVDRLLDSGKLPELHLRGFSGRYNFAGPGTNLKKRLDKNQKPFPGSKPINRVDASAYRHDIAYENNKSHEARKKADIDMINELNDVINDKKTGWREKGDAYIVRTAIQTKKLLGLGKKKRNVKKLKTFPLY